MANENVPEIVHKVWSFCNPLRDIGVGYGDYLEQPTYLQKMPKASNLYRKSKPSPNPTPKGSNKNHNDELAEQLMKTDKSSERKYAKETSGIVFYKTN